MIFNTLVYYAVFLAPTAVLFRVLPARLRPWLCCVAGSAFFVYFSVTTAGGWAGAACLAVFVWESLFSRLYRPGATVCLAGIVISVLVLGAFKYWNFLTGALALPLGHNPFHWAGAFLPLGVSFYTFEFIHYAADRYTGKAERGRLSEYLAFIFFFPTMVAGPIKRYENFVPCLRNPSRDWAADWNRGVTRILVGLVKKFAVADVLTSLTDHLNRSDIAQADRRVLLVWLFAYGWKIYFDFSAYSDIAIGSARLFGIRVPENFDWPYFRTNIAEFWRHWHISLYRWLVDYVYVPLGGSRVNAPRVHVNILVTMLISGFWHGAGWGFIMWGLWHGVLLVIHRVWLRLRKGARTTPAGPAARFGGWLLTYVAVNLGWGFFAMDFATAIYFYQRLLGG
jgi:alginate O-acetyltransferase complex protein AlgI